MPDLKIINMADGCITLENEYLGLYAVGSTLQDASASLLEDIEFMLSSYVKETDENLTQDAQALKRKLLSYITEE